MTMKARAAAGRKEGPGTGRLADGRLHLSHGPIDLIIRVEGETGAVEAAESRAIQRFETMLCELVAELPDLRRPVSRTARRFNSATARRMEEAARQHWPFFITPMAAVAGSVADEMLSAIMAGAGSERAPSALTRVHVNNGGDAAFHLAAGENLTLAIAGHDGVISRKSLDDLPARITIPAFSPIRGVATSGWHGRSHSMGIADAVTVLARTAGQADAAATLIANEIDVEAREHPAIRRLPARCLMPDSDLGDRPVTVAVNPDLLSQDDIASALERGCRLADDLARRGLIEAAVLFLSGQSAMTDKTSWQGVLTHQRDMEFVDG